MQYDIYTFDENTHFYVNIVSVSRSRMPRRMKFYMVHEGKLHNMTPVIAKAKGKNLTKDDCLRVRGCGMDMVFAALCSFASAIGIDEPHCQGWANHYTLI